VLTLQKSGPWQLLAVVISRASRDSELFISQYLSNDSPQRRHAVQHVHDTVCSFHIVEDFYATRFLGEGGNGAVFAGRQGEHRADVFAGVVHREFTTSCIDRDREVAIKCSTDLETLQVRASTSVVSSQIRLLESKVHILPTSHHLQVEYDLLEYLHRCRSPFSLVPRPFMLGMQPLVSPVVDSEGNHATSRDKSMYHVVITHLHVCAASLPWCKYQLAFRHLAYFMGVPPRCANMETSPSRCSSRPNS
jgi:hypothetical protein